MIQLTPHHWRPLQYCRSQETGVNYWLDASTKQTIEVRIFELDCSKNAQIVIIASKKQWQWQ